MKVYLRHDASQVIQPDGGRSQAMPAAGATLLSSGVVHQQRRLHQVREGRGVR